MARKTKEEDDKEDQSRGSCGRGWRGRPRQVDGEEDREEDDEEGQRKES